MPGTRLALYSEELNTYIDGFPDDRLRKIVWTVAVFIIKQLNVTDQRIDDLVRSPIPIVDEKRRTAVAEFCLELDEIGWQLQALVDEGKASNEEQLAAFERARAVNALMEAMGPDARTAAGEGLYEAIAATDVDTVDGLVRSVS